MKERKLQLQNSRILFIAGALLSILILLATRPAAGFVAAPAVDTVVGNPAASQPAERVDGSIKNMVINMSDSFTNYGNSSITVGFTDFAFRAMNANVPITPFVVKVDSGTEIADGEFTVVAVGTTRFAYEIGNQSFDFWDGSVKTTSLAPGETLLVGFMDANSNGNNATVVNGNGETVGATVALADTGDLVWYSFSSNNENQGFKVQEGQAPTPVKYGNEPEVVLQLARNYAFNITFETASTPAPPPATPTPVPADNPIMNGSFEEDSTGNGKSSLNDWTVIGEDGVDVINSKQSEGQKSLDLNTSTISQTVSGLTPNAPYVLRIDYRGNTGFGIGTTADASVFINGEEMGMGLYRDSDNTPLGIHTNEQADWVVCNGFEFTSATGSATFVIDSGETGGAPNGLLIDNIRIEEGMMPAPPSHNYADLALEPGDWRALANGDFEAAIGLASSDPENTGPDNNPHLCGDALPDWRVTRESVDLINNTNSPGSAQDDTWIMDVGGQGPGGLAQTITGLEANSLYVMRFYAARHIEYLEQGEMTSELWANGELVTEIVRQLDETYDDNYTLELVEMMSDENGEITFELFSTVDGKSGNIVYDNFSIIARSELPDLTPPGDQMGNVGELGFLELIAANNEDNTLTFSADGLPDGLAIDSTTGVITGTLQTAGTYTVTVDLTGGDIPASVMFNWFVNTIPVVSDISDQVNIEGDEINLEVVATDADDDVLEYGAMNLPAGVEILTDTGKITGTVTGIGFYTVTVTVDDGNGGEAETVFTMDVNDAPEIDAIEDQVSNVNDMISLEIAVSDEYKTDFVFGATNLPDGLTLDTATGLISGTVTTAGSYSVDVTVDDGAGGSDMLSFAWLVNTPPVVTDPGAQTGMVGDSINLPIEASDADGDTLTYSAVGLPAGLTIDASTGIISGEFEADGQSTSTITVSDGNGGTAEIMIDWDIEPLPPVNTGVTIFLPMVTR